jgi:hypothetical protein
VGGSEAQGIDVGLAEGGIAQLVGLVEELHQGGLEGSALGDSQSLGDRAGRIVAHHDLQGDDLDLVGEEALLVELADVVSGDILGGEELEEPHRDLGGKRPFAGDGGALFAVEGGDGVGEAHDDRLGVGGGQELFGFALVEELVHDILW